MPDPSKRRPVLASLTLFRLEVVPDTMSLRTIKWVLTGGWRWCLVFWILAAALGAQAGTLDPAVAFDEANKLYEQGRFGAAAVAYEALLEMGQTTPTVYFNLGNARFKNGEVGRAIQAFRQAERLAPRDAGIQSNLLYARRSVKGAEEAAVSWARRWLGRLSGNEWAWAATLLSWVFFLCLALREWRPELRTRLRWAVRISGILWVGSVLALVSVMDRGSQTQAVVVVKEAAVRFTPLDESPVVFNALDGWELVVLGQKSAGAGQGDWLEVRDAASRTGWVKRQQVGLVSESARKNPKA